VFLGPNGGAGISEDTIGPANCLSAPIELGADFNRAALSLHVICPLLAQDRDLHPSCLLSFYRGPTGPLGGRALAAD